MAHGTSSRLTTALQESSQSSCRDLGSNVFVNMVALKRFLKLPAPAPLSTAETRDLARTSRNLTFQACKPTFRFSTSSIHDSFVPSGGEIAEYVFGRTLAHRLPMCSDELPPPNHHPRRQQRPHPSLRD
ncbi:hypothetical protein VFPBJ_06742 [Purpureocillium lilacinum]|uniref:Uncharacterized protein n=1 Tax=Purpureocillium lilacinum TaxID=33203 RepID=A0A179GMQ7_PURLI|nr:hypothetical protein VFPBJ_06742 [Purpureocillium lilacinum]